MFAKGVVAPAAAAPAPAPVPPDAPPAAPPAPVAPVWEVSGSGAFSALKVGLQSQPLTITVKNTGNGPGTPSIASLSGLTPEDFLVVSNGCAREIPALQSCTVAVSFAPLAMGARSADLKISADVVQFSGEGLNPDPHAAAVSLSLAMEGPDGSTNFSDATGLAVSSVGVVHRAAFEGGGTAGYFNGAARSYLITANSPAFGFGTGDFTMEAWVNYSVGGCIISLRSDGAHVYFSNVLQISQGRLAWSDGSTWHTGAINIPQNTWAHVAVSRASGTLRLFVNGQQAGQVYQPIDLGSSRVARMGILEDNYIPYTGYMADLRVTKGVARYASSFTPPSL